MSDDNPGSNLTRRTILRRTAVGTAALGVGIPVLSGSAAASFCPRTPGYWANTDWCTIYANPERPEIGTVAESLGLSCPPDRSTYELDNTGVAMTQSEWQTFLLAPTRGDKSTKMAQMLLALTLNFQGRPVNDPTCVDKEVDLSAYGLGTTTIREVKALAQQWLRKSDFGEDANGNGANGKGANGNGANGNGANGNGNGPSNGNGPGNGANGNGWVVDGIDGEPLKDVLDAFNNGTIPGLDCSCDPKDD